MTSPVDALVRVTVAAPQRRIDVALPENVPLAELLPHILHHAGESVADDGLRHGGWALYRATGGALDPGRAFSVQGVRDGEVLHLKPQRTQWPELEYDDVVEAIASGARRYGRSWGNVATRRAALAALCTLLAFGLAALGLSAAPLALSGGVGIAVAVVLLGAGITLSRAMADASAGAVVAGCALPYAALGGLLVAAPADRGLLGVGAPHVMLGSATLLTAAVIGYVGVAGLARIFSAGISVGVFGLISGIIGLSSMTPAGVASIALTLAIALLPGYPLMSIRLGKLPTPALPQKAEDLLKDQPMPPRNTVFDAVARSDEILTGLLIGASVVSLVAAVRMVLAGGAAPVVLAVEAMLALLLRSRLFPTPRQRVPLIVSALGIIALLAVGYAMRAGDIGGVVEVAVLVVISGFVLSAAMVYSRRPPSPYMGRIADILDVIAIISLIPTACVITGFYGYVQAILAGVGG